MTDKIERTKILTKIWKKTKNRKRKCLVSDCQQRSINSHLLQRRGILSEITREGKIVSLGHDSLYNGGTLKLDLIGLNAGMSLNLFCGFHDNDLFDEIEKKEFDESDYIVQLLFAYRSICCELRKKEIQYENLSISIDNKRLKQIANLDWLKNMKVVKEGFRLGIKDLSLFKKEAEIDLYSEDMSDSRFRFYSYDFERIDVCCSAMFSPTNTITKELQEEPFSAVFVNIFPYRNRTIIILGYHVEYDSIWIKNYCEKFDGMNLNSFKLEISNILIKRCETWAISPQLYDKIDNVKRGRILSEFRQDLENLDEDMNSDLNIFDN